MRKNRIFLSTLSSLILLLFSFSLILPDTFSSDLIVQDFNGEKVVFNCTEIEKITSKPLHYLGHGGQAMAFESNDGQFVIKFFLTKRIHRRIRIKPFSIYQRFFSNKPFNATRDRTEILSRYKIAFERIKEETGLIAIHLSPSSNALLPCTIVDYNGNSHIIDLTRTSFVIQKKAQCVGKTFSKIPLEKQLKTFSSLERLLEQIAVKGFKNRSKRFNENNFAFVDNKAIMIDLGHLIFSEDQKADPNNELQRVQKLLKAWKRKLVFYCSAIL